MTLASKPIFLIPLKLIRMIILDNQGLHCLDFNIENPIILIIRIFMILLDVHFSRLHRDVTFLLVMQF